MLKLFIGPIVVLAVLAAGVWYLFFRDKPEESPEVNPSSPAAIKTVREAKIQDKWTVRQLSVNINTQLTVVLTLAGGDKVDGYFYVEKGEGINFNITGASPIYQSSPVGAAKTRVTSDRFSFTASQAQGSAYSLTFSASGAEGQETGGAAFFLEIIYPASGLLYVPIGTK